MTETKETKELIDKLDKLVQVMADKAAPKKKKKPETEEESQSAQRTEDFMGQVLGLTQELDVAYDEEKQVFTYEGVSYPNEKLAQMLLMGLPRKGAPKAGVIAAALDVLLARRKEAAFENLRRSLGIYDSSLGDRPIRKFVGLLTGKYGFDANETDIAAVMSFIWQVKRKLQGFYTIPDAMVINVWGHGGFGKSYLMDRLTQVAKAVRGLNMGVGTLKNTKEHIRFSEKYIIGFNDSGRIPKELRELVKMLITDNPLEVEVKHRGMQTVANKATWFMTNNYPIAEIFQDPTGMRRFWDIQVPSRDWNPEEDESYLAQIDFLRLWQSVDGGQTHSPMRPLLAEIRAEQAEYRLVSTAERAWLASFTQEENAFFILEEEFHVVTEFYSLAHEEKAPSVSAFYVECKRLFGLQKKNLSGRHKILGWRPKTREEKAQEETQEEVSGK